MEEETTTKKALRKDTKIPNVMICDKRIKTAAKYKIADVPHPYTSREEYERAMQMPVGGMSSYKINPFLFSHPSKHFDDDGDMCM